MMELKLINFLLCLTLINVCAGAEIKKDDGGTTKGPAVQGSQSVTSGEETTSKQKRAPLSGVTNFFRKLVLDGESAFTKGQAQYNQGNYRDALTLFNIAIEKKQSDFDACYLSRGKCYLKMNMPEKAARDFDLVAGRHALSTGDGIHNLIENIIDLEGYEKVVADIEQLKASALIGFGHSSCNQKEFKRAIRAFDGALLKQPCEEHYLARAMCYIKMGKVDEARSDWSNGQKSKPYYSKLPGATSFRHDMGLRPENEMIMKQLVESNLHNKDLEGKVLTNHGDFAQVGNEFFDAGRYDDAIDMFTIAIKIKSLPEYYQKRGDCYSKLGRENEARKDHEEATKLSN